MGFYPRNPNLPPTRELQTDTPNVKILNELRYASVFDAGSPVVADVNRIVVSVDMKVGAYTIAAATPADGGTRNVTVTVTQQVEDDTEGTLDIVGTDIDDQVLLETLTPLIGSTIKGTKAFKTVTSVTGVGWVTGGTADKIEVGFGDLIGLPDLMENNLVLFILFNAVREAAAAVTFSTTVLSLNTVDPTSALDGSAVVVYYLI